MKDWFRHDCDAWLDDKTMELRELHGLAGYGFYWAIIELIRASSELKIKDSPNTLAAFLNIDKPLANQLLLDSKAIGLLVSENGYIYSPSLNRRMAQYDAVCAIRKEVGKRGGRPKTSNESSILKPIANQRKKFSKPNVTNINERKGTKDLSLNKLRESRVAAATRINMTQNELDSLQSEYGDLFTQELAKASDWSLAKGKTHKDGGAFMRNWMKRAAASARLSASSGHQLKDFKTIEFENKQKRQEAAAQVLKRVMGEDDKTPEAIDL
jgi:hypothetical protein